ncbi:MAG: hypothetical protein DRG33_08100 [Deltaproteobacteria bacterium]|nr:MAG: hypothetical protein DRG33_08100 [Deltaproteobacteria bacterium]
MKVSKWKVLGIAGALVLSYAVTTDAAQLKVDEDTFADFGFWTKVMYNNLDSRIESGDNDYNRNVIDVIDARFTIEGQINKVIQFYGEAVSTGSYDEDYYGYLGVSHRDSHFRFSEGGVNLVAAPELQLRIGKIRIPFTRMQLGDEYARINPIEPLYDPQGIITGILGDTGIVYKAYDNSALNGLTGTYVPNLLRFVDGGAVLHGDIGEGMLRYNIGVFNQATDDEPFNSISWAVRVEFTPTMAGFNPETTSTPKGWLKDSYLGKKGDILTIGVGYFSQDVDPDLEGTTYSELDVDGYTVDLFLEKKFQPAILNLEGAYIKLNDSHYEPRLTGNSFSINDNNKGDTYLWYVQGQLLYDGVMGIGKPAIFAKYEYAELDATGGDLEYSAWGAGINYYIEGNAARLSAGFTNVSYDDVAEDYLDVNNLEDNITDFYVQAQIMF